MRLVTLQNQSKAPALSQSDIEGAAAALQTQVDRDFFPVWGKRCQVVALGPKEAVPSGAWPMTIKTHSQAGLGVHLTKKGTPFAEISATPDWTVTASHELLEMLEDPLGKKFMTGPDIDASSDGHMVRYLVEVGDPCEVFTYTIAGVQVSDFILREFYDENAGAGTSADFLSRLASPFAVPAGCYISWIDPADGRWHQKQPNGTFVTAKATADPKANPREDRDRAFGADERHDLSSIRARHRAS